MAAPLTLLLAPWLAALLALLAALPAPPAARRAGWPPTSSLRVNTSPSLPRGLYLLDSIHRAPAAGDLVLACPPPAAAALALERGYLDPGPCPGGTKPLGKLVLAAAGDRLELAAAAIALHHCQLPSSASQAADTRGRPLPHFPPGAYRVQRGEVWLFSPHPRSFDSRYFGPVAATDLRGVLRPVLVLSSPALPRWSSLLRTCTAAAP